ncbi:hypothetical protein SLS62_003569 [Diatrype stigma]|uniref:Uncharacterized protein n=1 Tax=Diatrype stigma TaxID=117547 RepID=A0AAN9YPX1_9PEZI
MYMITQTGVPRPKRGITIVETLHPTLTAKDLAYHIRMHLKIPCQVALLAAGGVARAQVQVQAQVRVEAQVSTPCHGSRRIACSSPLSGRSTGMAAMMTTTATSTKTIATVATVKKTSASTVIFKEEEPKANAMTIRVGIATDSSSRLGTLTRTRKELAIGGVMPTTTMTTAVTAVESLGPGTSLGGIGVSSGGVAAATDMIDTGCNSKGVRPSNSRERIKG